MPGLSAADHRSVPPRVAISRDYNAAYDLLERNIGAGRGERIAFIDDAGSYTYGELGARVQRCARALLALDLRAEERVMLCLHDSIDFPVAFLGCIFAGLVPVPVNTQLTPADYAYMLEDSRASALVVSAPLLGHFSPGLPSHRHLRQVIVSGTAAQGNLSLEALLGAHEVAAEPAATCSDEPCFWLYSSGSTGAPKGTVHAHSSLVLTAELYARPVLDLGEQDVVFSAAKLFFAYGLGNALTFPMSVGACAVLTAERPTAQVVFDRLRRHRPTVFYGVPTLYASLMASPDLPARGELALRLCTSAGEALPAPIARNWTEHFGVEVLDGIGSTEMLHIFVSNRAGDVRYGTTGKPVPGYAARLVDDDGQATPAGQIGELQVNGPTSALCYWNNRDRSRSTFLGPWTRTGDKYRIDDAGYYVYAGRADDMLKVGGVYVSPAEVEAALVTHPSVLEAAVVGRADEDQLVKPAAFVVLRAGVEATSALELDLKQHVKSLLAPYKYPRWVEFLEQLPKTATGKIQRFRLRAAASRE